MSVRKEKPIHFKCHVKNQEHSPCDGIINMKAVKRKYNWGPKPPISLAQPWCNAPKFRLCNF